MTSASRSPALVILCVVFLLSGCAGVDPASLRPAQSSRSISLNAPYRYEEYYSLAGNRMIYSLAVGQYVARYEDDHGTYFEGPGKCFEIQVISDSLTQKGLPQYKPHSYRCGVYVPQRTDLMPKVYFYRDAEVSAAVFSDDKAPVISAIDAAELKNLHFYQDQPKDDSLKRALQFR